MAAIKIHHTATSNGPWDGPANKAAISNDAGESVLREAFAWVDPDKDPDTKTAYKFIHHEVSSGGKIGAANIKGCQSGIGVLNGAMGGANIPDADRKGVWRHLAAHLKDAKLEPGELNSLISDYELRNIITEVRVDQGENKKPVIKGYAIVFNKLSDDLGGFREQVAPKSCKNTILNDDIRAAQNHDPNYILGRNKAGTLKLVEDDEGVHFDIDPPDTQWCRDLQVSINRGDINQCSFKFNAIKDSWENKKDGSVIRTLDEIKLFDISIVTYPAYQQTSAKVRDYLSALSESKEDKPDPRESPSQRGAAGSLASHKRKLDIAERI
jgi:hypothetical protein